MYVQEYYMRVQLTVCTESCMQPSSMPNLTSLPITFNRQSIFVAFFPNDLLHLHASPATLCSNRVVMETNETFISS